MGAVFEARHHETGEVVALKVLIGLVDERAVERFLVEARAASRIAHPNVVRVHGSGRDGGKPWIAFELVPGGSLRDRLRMSGALPWREAARTAADVANGLEAIHAPDLVHRDLKPENILFAADGRAMVSDLGLVRSHASDLTRTGELLGTLAYMAPEQIEDSRDAEPRSDLYALGVVLYEMLSGKRPFTGQGLLLAKSQLTKPPPPLAELAPGAPKSLVALVEHLLAKTPDARPKTADSVANELTLLLAEREKRSRLPVVLGLLAVLAAGGGALVAFAKGTVPHEVKPVPIAPPRVPAPAPPRPVPKPTAGYQDESVLVSSDHAESELIQRAEAAFANGDHDGSLAAYDAALLAHPEWLRIRFRRAERRVNVGRTQEAIGDLDAVIVAFPELLRAYMLRGFARRLGHDLEGARADYDFIIKRAPNDAEFCMHDADFRLELAEYDRAIEDVNRVLDGAPSEVRVTLVRCRGDALYKLRRYALVIPDYEEALKALPDDVDLRFRYLQSLDWDRDPETRQHRHPEKVKEAATALLRFGEALSNDRFAEAFIARGEAHGVLREWTEYRADFKKAIDYESNPKTVEWLRESIARCESALAKEKK